MKLGKVIFLDIDGVLALTQQWGKDVYTPCGVMAYRFSPHCVSIFNEILEETGAEIILTSDWKLFYDLHTMKCLFRWNEVSKGPVGFTADIYVEPKKLSENIKPRKRANEILDWLSRNQVDRYVVIDDLPLEAWFTPETFVRCKYEREGISQAGLKEQIIKLINND